MKLDLLALAAHPDDVELACSGIIAKQISLGYTCGIADLTRGELGSRGNAETRKVEAEAASEILKLHYRTNLGMADGFFEETEENLLKIATQIRFNRPEILLINAPSDRHPDHGRAANLCLRANFLAGLAKIKTSFNGEEQSHYRAPQVFHFIQDRYLQPGIVVDITEFWREKMNAVMAYKTQFYNPDEPNELNTPISGADFIAFLEARAREMGRLGGVEFGEGLIPARTPLVSDLFHLK